MKTLQLTKNWRYEPGNEFSQEGDGYFALGLIDKKLGTATSKLTDRQDYIDSFGYGTWYKCREQFHKVFTEKDKSILYVHAGNLTPNIAEFITKIENVIGIARKEQTECFLTQRTTITAIRPAKFWLSCPMRRQIFSLILRSGRNHIIGNDYSVALLNSKYSKETFHIINLFISGYNTFNQKCLDILEDNHHHGFYHQFNGVTVEQARNVLLTQSTVTTTKSLL